jgi:hypothetical protein
MKRHPTKYPGVFYREAERIGGPGTEKVFYIVFKRDGKVIEEKCGPVCRQHDGGQGGPLSSGAHRKQATVAERNPRGA